MVALSLLSSTMQRDLSAADPRWRLKTILNACTLLTTLIAIFAFGTAIPKWNANFFHQTGPNRGDWTDGMPLAPLLLTFFFSSLSLTITFMKRSPLFPKICIGIYTILLLTFIPCIVLAGIGGLFPYWQSQKMRDSRGNAICNSANMFSRECLPPIFAIGELQIAGITFSVLTWFLMVALLGVSLMEMRADRAASGGGRSMKRALTMKDMEKDGAGGKESSARDKQHKRFHIGRKESKAQYRPSMDWSRSHSDPGRTQTVSFTAYIQSPDNVHPGVQRYK